MLRLPLWLTSTLGTAVLLMASCSSDDANPVRAAGGQADGGAVDANPGGGAGVAGTAAPDGGAASPNGGAATGGESASELTDEWLSGTRLRAVLDVSGDAKRFKIWHDTELDVDCMFMPDSNKVERCMPDVEHGFAVYRDAKCSKAVGVFEADDPIPLYLPEPRRFVECETDASYLEVGADATGVTDLFSESNGSCIANGMVGATQVVKQLGPVAAPSTFVAATKVMREPRDTRLEANVRVGEDGSRQVIGFFDLERKVDCNPLERELGYACVPNNLAFLEVYFSDDKCKVPAAYYPGCNGTPTIILDSSPSNTGQYFEVGALVATPPLFAKYSVCQPYTSTVEPNARYYSPGKEVPWSAFPQLAAQEQGTGRIAVTVLRGVGDDELLARADFFDAGLNTHCGVGAAADSKARCLPHTPWSVNAFSDAECSSGLFENKAGDPLPVGLDFLNAGAPGGGTAIFKIGPKIALPAKTWQRSAQGCEERSVSADTDYYSTTTIPPSGLALVTREVE